MPALLAMIAMAALAAIVVAVLMTVSHGLARKRKPARNAGSAVGNALFQLHTLLSPSAQNITEARKRRREDAGQGDDNEPELPPWAQSNK
jgi:hypothetical protein